MTTKNLINFLEYFTEDTLVEFKMMKIGETGGYIHRLEDEKEIPTIHKETASPYSGLTRIIDNIMKELIKINNKIIDGGKIIEIEPASFEIRIHIGDDFQRMLLLNGDKVVFDYTDGEEDCSDMEKGIKFLLEVASQAKELNYEG